MMLESIDHVQLAMPSGGEVRARAFYSDTLGLPEVAKPAHLAVGGGAWFESVQVKIHLGVDIHFVPAQKAHPAFVVRDLVGLIERCQNGGYEIVNDEPLAGYERVYVSDPFGNRIEFMERSL